MKKVLSLAFLLGILVSFGLFYFREGNFVRATLKGAYFFSVKEFPKAVEAFSSDEGTLGSEISRNVAKRFHLALSHAASQVEAGSWTDAAIATLGEISFSGNAELEALRLYDLWNAYVQDALTHTGTISRMSFESALSAYTGSLSIRWDADTEHNYLEVLRRLQGDVAEKPPEEEAGEEPKEGSGANAWEASESGSGNKSEEGSGTGHLKPNSGNWSNGWDPKPLESSTEDRSETGDAPKELSPAEREELRGHLEGIRDLQKEQGKYVRPDGAPDSVSGIPGGLKGFFQGDPFFEKFFGNESGGTGKNW